LYSGCFIVLEAILNIPDYKLSELIYAPVEFVGEGDGQSMSGLMPGLDEKDSLTHNSSSNTSSGNTGSSNTTVASQGNSDVPSWRVDASNRQRIDTCPNHSFTNCVEVSPQEHYEGQFPMCDRRVYSGGRTHTHSSIDYPNGLRRFFICNKCDMVVCRPCAVLLSR